MQNERGPRDSSVQSVDRAVSILQAMARRGDARVSEISEELGVHKSTVFRLLSTMEARGLVEQDADRGRYRLAYGVVQLAGAVTRRLDLSVLSRPVCQRLADEVGETVNVAIDDGEAMISIDQVIGSSTVTTVNWVGRRTPMHATSSGKLVLAHMPEAERRARLRGKLERFTEHTIRDRKALAREFEAIRDQGYAQARDEHEPGLSAIAAPIFDLEANVVAGLTVSGPTFRLTAEVLPDIGKHLLAAAEEISQRNGFPKRG